MKQTVKEAAREHQSKFEVCNDVVLSVSGAYDNGVHDQSYDSFIAGAAWRINSVWHDWKDELPECGKHAVSDEWMDFIATDERDLKRIVKSYGNGKWAYVDDLLLDTIDDILEANRDVLERIKVKGD